jgi:GT2 family glycosyltransferase
MRRSIVAIPVRNEQDHIGACLAALARQRGAQPDGIVLLLNNCTDSSADCIRSVNSGVPCDLIELELHGSRATAGFARSLAMRLAAEKLSDNDVLLTTDADGQVEPDWLAENLLAIEEGADAVCGMADLDPVDARQIPAHLHADDARECELAALLDEMSAFLDPDPADPLPRHTQHSGASIAVTVAAWRRAGGMPPVPSGEDRAFIEKLRRVDMRIRHSPSVRVVVSGRTRGRAAGGMAETIARRMVRQDEFADCTIEPAAERFARAMLRGQARAAWVRGVTDAGEIAHELQIPTDFVCTALAQPFFGAAWAALEARSPILAPRSVRFAELAHEIEVARALCARARNFAIDNTPALAAA